MRIFQERLYNDSLLFISFEDRLLEKQQELIETIYKKYDTAIEGIDGQSHHYQLLEPKIVAFMLEQVGFKVPGVNLLRDNNGTIILLARKHS